MKFRTTLTKRVSEELKRKGRSHKIDAFVKPSWEFYETERGEIAAWDRNCPCRFIDTGFSWKTGKSALRRAVKKLDVFFRFDYEAKI